MTNPTTPASGDEPALPEWLHLKQYGYAPGNYLSRCYSCSKVVEFLDKRATCCRPCAEERHALAARQSPAAPAGDQGELPVLCAIPKFESELQLVAAAQEEKETKYLNWSDGPEGKYWTIDSFRGNRCSAAAYADGDFTRLVQDPFARVNHG